MRRKTMGAVRAMAGLAVAGALLAGCTASTNGDNSAPGASGTTVRSSASLTGPTGAPSTSSATNPPTPSSTPPTPSTAPSTSNPPSSPPPSRPSNSPSTSTGGNPHDSFKPTKLKPGEKPPQFVVVSFDGAGWHEKWQYFNAIADKVPVDYTMFLSGIYLVDAEHKTAYTGPGHAPGKASIAWMSRDEVIQEVKDLNEGYNRGYEIGTHYNGHFCADNPPGGADWSTAQWNQELDQFFAFLKDYKTINGFSDSDVPDLEFGADEIKGGRTPCLEGDVEKLFPALKAHGMDYDSSPSRRGLSWPTRGPATGIWKMGMPEFPIAGTGHRAIIMDYNFWYVQEGTKTASPAKAAQDGQQVLQTYRNMYQAAYSGNRAPIIIGNHFNDWNHNVYNKAVGDFVLETCGQPDTYCVTFSDVIDWMEMQDPAVLAHLQSLPPELG